MFGIRIGDIVRVKESTLKCPYHKDLPTQCFTVAGFNNKGTVDEHVVPKEDIGKYRNGVYSSDVEIVQALIDDQTVAFWNLQLQFMEMSSYALKELFKSLDFVGMYSVNKHTTKIESLVYRSDSYKPLSENDHNCLATHLALQLSGLA